jgi:hypothetical protein
MQNENITANSLSYKFKSSKQNIVNQFVEEITTDIPQLKQITIIKENLILLLKHIDNMLNITNKESIYNVKAEIKLIEKEIDFILKDVATILIDSKTNKNRYNISQFILGKSTLNIENINDYFSILLKIRNTKNFSDKKKNSIELEYKSSEDIMRYFIQNIESLKNFCNKDRILSYFEVSNIKSIVENQAKIKDDIAKIKTQYIDKKYRQDIENRKNIIINIIDYLSDNLNYLDKFIEIDEESIKIDKTNAHFISNIIFYKSIRLLEDIELRVLIDKNFTTTKNHNDIKSDAIVSINKIEPAFIKQQLSKIDKSKNSLNLLVSRINKIDFITKNIIHAFEINIQNLKQSLIEAEKKYEDFTTNKDNIEDNLKIEIDRYIDKQFNVINNDLSEAIDKIINRFGKKEYYKEQAKREKVFQNTSLKKDDENNYELKAEKFTNSIMMILNEVVDDELQLILRKNNVELQNNVLTSLKSIQKKYESDLGVKINLAEIDMPKLDVSIKNNISFQLGFWQTVKVALSIITRTNEIEYIDIYANKWEELVEKIYIKLLHTETKATLYTTKNRISMIINEEIPNILDIIESQLKQQVIDQKNLEKDSIALIRRKEFVKDEFVNLEDIYINKIKLQGKKLIED